MAGIVIIGAGLAGLASALFLARRGHDVTLIEADPPPVGVNDEDAFRSWPRRGVGQMRQTHNFMGLSSAVLARQAPDVMEALEARGARLYSRGLTDRDGTPAPMVFARRSTYERTLREAVEREARVRILSGAAAQGLIAESGDPPRVSGVVASGERFAGDLVIDCAGRKSRAAKWLGAIGSRSPAEEVHPCGLMYLTRWYRLRPGEDFPDAPPPVFARMSYANLFIAHADAATFSITFTLSEADPLRRALRDGEAFDRAAAAVPAAAPFLARATAETEPLPYGAIVNGRRSLVDEEGPVVAGYLLIGDSSMHTNPTLGRGVSLAFAQAERLALTLDRAGADLVAAQEEWSRSELGVWFDTQVEVDSAYAAQCAAIARGEDPPDPPFALRAQHALAAAAEGDEQVERALRRLMNLLARPDELRGDAAVVAAVGARLALAPEPAGASDPLPRRRFEALLSG